MRVEVSFRSEPKVGESESGDAVVLRRCESGRTLVAVIDALGHGPVAAAVARAAQAALEQEALERGAGRLLEAAHAALRATRGAALTLAVFEGTGAEVCGVGNVQLRGLTRPLPFAPSPGIVGTKMGRPRVTRLDLRAGDRLLVYSDGIPRRADVLALSALSPGPLCDALLAQRHSHDDATALVASLDP